MRVPQRRIHGEYRRVLARLNKQLVNVDGLLVKLVRFPGAALVERVVQLVRLAGTVRLDGDDDRPVVAEVVQVGALEHLVPRNAAVRGQVRRELGHLGRGTGEGEAGRVADAALHRVAEDSGAHHQTDG